MDYRTKFKSNHEILHPIIIWIIASILFHLLLALGIITLKITSVPLMHHKQDTQEHAILMMNETKKTTVQSSIPAIPTTTKKSEEKKDSPKPSDYTLIPGRQGINLQNLDDLKNFKDLPKPQDQTLDKKVTLPENSKPEAQQEENIKEGKIQKKELVKNNTVPISIQESMHAHRQAISTNTKDVTSFTDQLSKKSSQKKVFQSKQDPYQFVPQPSRIISFKELNLGFDNNYATVGNNANLIQQGITTAAPDDISLKHLTYYNQCAGMMKTAFATHPQTRLRQNATGKRFRVHLTVDRQGNQIKLDIIRGSGDIILDRIIQESIESVKMFPKVPSFIPDSPFTMRWTFLH